MAGEAPTVEEPPKGGIVVHEAASVVIMNYGGLVLGADVQSDLVEVSVDLETILNGVGG